jgi:hypothetical protein
MNDIVRVLRVIEYVGPREAVEKQVSDSLHGQKQLNNGVLIKAATIGNYPEILQSADKESTFNDECGKQTGLGVY